MHTLRVLLVDGNFKLYGKALTIQEWLSALPAQS